jgi:lysozyme
MGTSVSDQMRAIDVYSGDGVIDWSAVLASGIGLAFVKATQGAAWVDKAFKRNWSQLGTVGLTRAPYHFFTGNAGGVVQANHCLEVVTLAEKSMPWVLDLEQAGHLSPSDLQINALHWLQTIESATGKPPIIYGPREDLKSWLQGNPSFARYPLWLAHPGSLPGPIPAPWTEYTFWQAVFGENPDGWRVPGCPGRVDGSYYRGSHADLVARFNLA